MDHKTFGNLNYKNEGWVGEATLPVFAAVGLRSEPKQLSDKERLELAKKALENVNQRAKNLLGKTRFKWLFEPFTKGIAKNIAKWEAEGNQPDPQAQVGEQKRAEQAAKRAAKAARLASGAFPIYILDPKKKGPSTQQVAAFQHLMADEDTLFKAVTNELFKSFEVAYSQEHWRKICRLTPAKTLADLTGQYAIKRVEIYREHLKGTSYLVFPLDTAWEGDSGIVVVYHPDKPPEWTTNAYEVI